jgi:hypothetical protein
MVGRQGHPTLSAKTASSLKQTRQGALNIDFMPAVAAGDICWFCAQDYARKQTINFGNSS